MSEETAFTRIVSGAAPAHTVYEGETTCAFLDADPVAPGHTLVVPREPYRRLVDVPPDVAGDLMATLQTLVPAVEAAVGAHAATVTLNDGAAAGQSVPHLHWHVVPRFEDDGTLVEYHPLVDGEFAEDELASIAADVREEHEG